MAVRKLSENAAFSPGADLWVFCDPKNSAFARKIDFYLNFRIARSQLLERRELPLPLQGYLAENELEELKETPLPPNRWMISTRRELPCRQVVMIPFQSDGKAWVQGAIATWQALQLETIRLFLPNAAAGVEINSLVSSVNSERVTYIAGDLNIEA